MNILIVSNYYPPYHAGGYGVLCHQMAEGLFCRNHNISVLTTVPSFTEEDPGGFHLSIPVYRKLVRADGRGVRLIKQLRHNHLCIKEMLATIQPDLVYEFSIDGIGYQVHHDLITSGVPVVTYAGDTWLSQVWRDLGRFDPWISLSHTKITANPRTWMKSMLSCIGRWSGLCREGAPIMANPVHAISSFVQKELFDSGIPNPEECKLILCPLNPGFLPVLSRKRTVSKNNTLKLLFLSRMEMLKGPDTAILATADVLRSGFDVTLSLAGIGTERTRDELQLLVDELGIQDYVNWAEARTTTALIDLYENHDVFLFPSRIIEGLGMVCLEAMACGLPVVGTKTGGQVDLIEEGITGCLIDHHDHQKMAHGVSLLHEDRSLLQFMSDNAKEKARKYDPVKVFDLAESLLFATLKEAQQKSNK